MSVPPQAATAKAALRARLLARRRARPETDRLRAAAAIADGLATGLAGLSTVAGYVPDLIEPGHGVLPAALTALADRIYLPVVPGSGTELSWAVYPTELYPTALVPGRFGLLEPVGPRLPPEALADAAAVVVPALAVGPDGARLGRGGGYYDRALRHAAPGAVLVAVVFDDEFLDDVPAEPHDVPMTAVVTPSGGWRQLDSAGSGPH